MRISPTTAIVLAGSLILAGCGQDGGQQEQLPAAASENAAGASAAPDSASSTEPVTWAFPAIIDGWSPNNTGQTNAQQLINEQGCQYNATQNTYNNNPPKGDLAATQEQVGFWKGQITTVSPDATFDTKESNEINGDASTTVATLRTDAQYLGEDGSNYKTVVWIRSFTTSPTPGFVSLTYGCPESAFSEEEAKSLREQTRLLNVTAADSRFN